VVTLKIKFDLLETRRYLRENWGAPFIVLSQMLLLSGGYLLIQGDSALANAIAMYAYFSLLIGITLQLISFLKDGRRKQEKDA
jgi:hypothetical protein